MHVHAAPDMIERTCDDIDMAYAVAASGMDGAVIKNHYGCTAQGVRDVNKLVGRTALFSSLTLNRYVGGFNPYAVEAALGLGARVIWFPTRHAKNHLAQELDANCTFNASIPLRHANGLNALDEHGKLLPDIIEIIDLIAKADVCLCTGHLSNHEAITLCRTALHRGVRRVVFTHPDFTLNELPLDIQEELARQNVFMEKTLFTVSAGIVSAKEMLSGVRRIGLSRCFLASDYGMITRPAPWKGMSQWIALAHENGFTDEETGMVVSRVPRFLVGLEDELPSS